MADLVRNVIEMKNIAHMDLFRLSFGRNQFDFSKVIKEPNYREIKQIPSEWKINNWGSIQNAYDTDIESNDRISFLSPWEPPMPVFRKLFEMFPDADISCRYASENIGAGTGFIERVNLEICECYYDDYSQEGYETYIDIWNDTDCLYKDDNGKWQRKSCDSCGKCDTWKEGEF